MKNTIKTLSLHTFVIAVLCACTNGQPRGNTQDTAQVVNEEKFNPNNAKDAQFMVNATATSLEEIELSKLAQQNGSKAVKELGKMMADAHTKSLQEATALAKSKIIAVQTALSDSAKDNYTKLSNLKGAEFDKTYCDIITVGHKAAIADFEQASSNAVDAEIKQWATTTLPELRTHLNDILACQKKLGEGK